MKTLTVLFLIPLVLLLQTSQGNAQDSLTVKDAGDIRFKSEKIIKELNDLLNVLSNSDIETKEKYDLILNSFAGASNRIFKDSTVLVEDDSNPMFRSTATSKDETIANYLKDFDLFYRKSDNPSVELTNIRSSRVKKSDDLYVKVYFNSQFNNKSTNDVPYALNNRVAEIRITKERNKWIVRIGRLGFFNPADTVGDTRNDLALASGIKVNAGLSGSDSSLAAQALSAEDLAADDRRKKEAEEERIKKDKIRTFLNKGDKALSLGDFTAALSAYADAREVDPYDLSVLASISKARNLEQTSTISSKEMYEKLLRKAKLEENNRQYAFALRDYNAAFALKPEEETNYDAHLKELNVRFRTLSDLEEKYNAGLYKDAIKEYDKAIKKDPKNSDYYLGRGKCYEKSGDNSRAVKDYSQSYGVDNNNVGALLCRASLYEKTNEPFKALTDYKTCITLDKENTDYYEKIASLHVQLKQNAEAIEDLNKAIELNPKAPHPYVSKALILMDKKDYKTAAENISTSLNQDSSSALAFFYRGKCYFNLKDYNHAASDFNSARSRGLPDINLKEIQGYANQFYEESQSAYASGKMGNAIETIDRSMLLDPTSALYAFKKGEYLFAIKDYKNAISYYDQAIVLKDNYAEAFYKRGLSYYKLGQYKEGLDNFTEELRFTPQDIMGVKGVGDCYYALKDYFHAASNYETCMRLISNSKNFNTSYEADILNAKGNSYYEMSNYEKALSDLKTAIKLNGNLTEAYYNRGKVYVKSNKIPDAIEDFNKAISMDNTHFQWHYAQGQALMEKKEFGNAAVSYENCLKADSLHQFPDAVYYKGYCNYEIQNFPNALNDYQQALHWGLDTAISGFTDQMGFIYLNLGKYDSAIVFYNKAYEKDNADGIASYGMGAALLQQGKKDEALTWFEKSFKTKAMKYGEIKKDKLVAGFRDDKRFKDLLKKYY